MNDMSGVLLHPPPNNIFKRAPKDNMITDKLKFKLIILILISAIFQQAPSGEEVFVNPKKAKGSYLPAKYFLTKRSDHAALSILGCPFTACPLTPGDVFASPEVDPAAERIPPFLSSSPSSS